MAHFKEDRTLNLNQYKLSIYHRFLIKLFTSGVLFLKGSKYDKMPKIDINGFRQYIFCPN